MTTTNEIGTEHTIYNMAGEKVGVAVWTGQRTESGIMYGWECFNLSDISIGETVSLVAARDLLNGFGG